MLAKPASTAPPRKQKQVHPGTAASWRRRFARKSRAARTEFEPRKKFARRTSPFVRKLFASKLKPKDGPGSYHLSITPLISPGGRVRAMQTRSRLASG